MRTRRDPVPAKVCAAGEIVLAVLLAGCVVPGTGGGCEVRETVNRIVSAGGVTP